MEARRTDEPAQPQRSRRNRRYAAVALVVVGALGVHFALLEYPLIRRAIRQPECDWDASVPWMVSMIVLAALCALGASLMVQGKGALRRGRNGVLCVLAILVFGSVFTPAYSTRLNYGLVMMNTDGLRSVYSARMYAQQEGTDDPSTVLVLLYDDRIEPNDLNFPNAGCGRRIPPLPPELIDYHGVIFEDVVLRRISREALIDAANRALGDEPWERIGSMYIRRSWDRRMYIHPELILAVNIITFARERRAIVLDVGGVPESWRASDPGLQAKLAAAIAATEAAGVAPPPQELIDFVNAATESPR